MGFVRNALFDIDPYADVPHDGILNIPVEPLSFFVCSGESNESIDAPLFQFLPQGPQKLLGNALVTEDLEDADSVQVSLCRTIKTAPDHGTVYPADDLSISKSQK